MTQALREKIEAIIRNRFGETGLTKAIASEFIEALQPDAGEAVYIVGHGWQCDVMPPLNTPLYLRPQPASLEAEKTNLQSECDAAGKLIGKLMEESAGKDERIAELQETVRQWGGAHQVAHADQSAEITQLRQQLAAASERLGADPLQGAADWFIDAIHECTVEDIQSRLTIGYNRAKRLHDAALANKEQPQ